MKPLGCFACRCASNMLPADVSFLAGIAFVHQFRDEAVTESLCQEHQKQLAERSSRTLPTIPTEWLRPE